MTTPGVPAMSYTLRLATEATRDLVVEALRAEADKRTRVARGAAQHVAADKLAGVKDVRSSAVRVAMLLAEAGTLAELADDLATAEEVPVVMIHRDAAAMVEELKGLDLTKLDDPTPLDVAAGRITREQALDRLLEDPEEDDGLSEAAHRAAELAGLEDAFVDPDGEDVETGATAEDEPGDDVEEALKP